MRALAFSAEIDAPKVVALSALGTLLLIIIVIFTILAIIGYRRLKTNALYNISYERAFSTDGIFAGERIDLTETISNPGWFPLFAVKIDFYVPAGLTVNDRKITEYTRLSSIFNIPPYSTVKRTFSVRADKRGKFSVCNATTKYRDTVFDFETDATFYAYPDYFDSSADNLPDIYQTGTEIARVKFIEDPFFISGIRDYRSGDPMRAINFKASVRSFSGGVRRLLCNNYDSSRTYDSMIFLDLNSYAQAAVDPLEQLETGLRLSCFIFREAVKNGGCIGFCTNRSSSSSKYVHIPCGSGEEHVKRMLREFAVIDHYGKRDYSMNAILQSIAFELPKNVDIYMITSFIDERTADLLFSLKRMGRNVQVIPLAEVKSNG
ncbi:MAG: DUF58 domain-containing protein [Clostridia bacterium]|nr:DUF58 domain-containing protein [Clostridia bacterium]MBQ9848221.1 DUF58 domain-containing protein [Clostridia bacterium]